MTTINARSFAYFAVCRLNNCRASGGYAMKFPLFVNFFLLLCVSQDTDDRESVLFLNEPAALPTFLVCIDAPINILNWWWADGIQSDAIVFALREGIPCIGAWRRWNYAMVHLHFTMRAWSHFHIFNIERLTLSATNFVFNVFHSPLIALASTRDFWESWYRCSGYEPVNCWATSVKC